MNLDCAEGPRQPCHQRGPGSANSTLPRQNFRSGVSGFSASAFTLNTLSTLLLIGFHVGGFPNLGGNSVRSVSACIGFDRLDVETSLMAFALDDEPGIFDKAAIVPAKQPRQHHAARVFYILSRHAD